MQHISFIFKALWREILALMYWTSLINFEHKLIYWFKYRKVELVVLGILRLYFLILKSCLSNNKSGKTRTTTNTCRTQRMKTQHTQSTLTRTIQQALNSCQLADHSPSTYTDIMQLFGNRIDIIYNNHYNNQFVYI